MKKYYRVPIREDRTTVCPVCGVVNRHITGKHCGHVAKITAKGIVFYWWNFFFPYVSAVNEKPLD